MTDAFAWLAEHVTSFAVLAAALVQTWRARQAAVAAAVAASTKALEACLADREHTGARIEDLRRRLEELRTEVLEHTPSTSRRAR